MISSGDHRLSVAQLISCLVVFLVSAIGVAALMVVAWRDWTVFAVAWAAMYFMGGARWLPWKTPIWKALSIGVFVGTALPAIEWLYRLNH